MYNVQFITDYSRNSWLSFLLFLLPQGEIILIIIISVKNPSAEFLFRYSIISKTAVQWAIAPRSTKTCQMAWKCLRLSWAKK